MHERTLIISTIITFAIAALFLAFTLQRQFNAADYWSIAFVAPHADDDYRFTITNNTPSDTFTYTLRDAAGTQTAPQRITVAPHTTQTITPQRPPHTTTPLSITVTHDDNTHILRK